MSFSNVKVSVIRSLLIVRDSVLKRVSRDQDTQKSEENLKKHRKDLTHTHRNKTSLHLCITSKRRAECDH